MRIETPLTSPALGAAEEIRLVNTYGAADLVSAVIELLLTLYMVAILVRWLGPWLELSTRSRCMRLMAWLTDPLVNLMRRLLPPMGPFDWGPVAALVAVWLVRLLLVQY